MNKIGRFLNALEEYTGPVILIAIFLDTLLQILSRMLPGNAVPWTLELGEILLSVLIWLGLSKGVVDNAHISFDLVTKKLPLRVRKVFDLFSTALFIVYLSLLGFLTVQALNTYLLYGSKTTILQIHVFWIRLPILIGCIAAILRLLIKEYKIFTNRNYSSPAECKDGSV